MKMYMDIQDKRGQHCIEAFEPYLKLSFTPHLVDVVSHACYVEGVLKQDEENKIKQTNDENKLDKFLGFLKQCERSDWYTTFIDVLKREKFELVHVADTLEGTGSASLGAEDYKVLLGKKFETLITKLDPEDFLPVWGHKLLDEQSLQAVNSKPTQRERVVLLLHLMPKRPNWFQNFKEALANYPQYEDVLKSLEETSEEESETRMDMSYFRNLMEVFSPLIVDTLSVTDILPYCTYLNFKHWDHVLNQKTDQEKAVTFLKILTSQPYNWFKHFLETLRHPGLKSIYDDLANMLDPPEESTPTKESCSELKTANVMVATTEERSNNKCFPSNLSKKLDFSEQSTSGQQNSLKLRNYQTELAQPALQGHNTIIVAPTGSGKTFIALDICLKHISKNPEAKVIFLVPRVPLVKQQYDLFKGYLGDGPGTIIQISGETSTTVPVHKSVENNKMIIMTAQILLNLLNDQLLKINAVSLIIIDECHHTNKNDPYNNIMGVYLDSKFGDENAKLPQVVGLTASPGLGKAKTMKVAEENLKTLMANLDVMMAPVQVRKHTKDLKMYQNEAHDELICIEKKREDPFQDNLKRAMAKIEAILEAEISEREKGKTLEGKIKYDLRSQKGTQGYEAWAVTLLRKSRCLQDKDVSAKFMAYATHLREYNNALVLNDHVRNSDAIEYLEEKLFRHPPKTPVDKELMTIKKENVHPIENTNPNPMLTSLEKKLSLEFKCNPESRCMIFVKTRAIAQALILILKNNIELDDLKLNPRYLTGAGVAGAAGGMTKFDQEDTLTTFRDGRCKVIVATSVAEEGLDIKACNLIITYNYSTNEIGQVQRQGRGRADKSKFVMLAYSDSGHVQRERDNKERVKCTQEIMDTIFSIKSEDLSKQVEKIQRASKKDRDFEKQVLELQRNKKQRNKTQTYQLLCLWCKRKVTTSQHFRHINNQHRVIVDQKFEKQAVFQEVEPGKSEISDREDEFVIGKIFCGNTKCSFLWGTRMRYKLCPISVVNIQNFVITSSKGYREVVRKWKDAPFRVVDELSAEDLSTLFPNSQQKDDDN